MPRADPARSDYCATRHLLGHLDDVHALRRNPLARRILTGVDPRGAPTALGEAVTRAFASMDSEDSERRWRTARHTVVLLRMDVGGERAPDVARDLGLSDRQLRRERRVAHARFRAALERLSEGAGTSLEPVAFVCERSAALQIERAERIADSGESISALAILDDVATHAGDAESRTRALVRGADVETSLHRLDRSRERLRDAQQLLLGGVVPAGSIGSLQREHRVAALQREWYEMGPAVVGATQAVTLDTSDPQFPLLQASAALRGGDAAAARRWTTRARNLLTGGDDGVVPIDLEILDAEIRSNLEGDVAGASRAFLRAIELAGRRGYGGRRLWATHRLAFNQWLHAPADRTARAAYRALVARIDASLAPQHRLMLYSSAADVESAIGSPRRAAEAARAVLRLATNRYERLSAQALLAGAMLREGRFEAAADIAATVATGGRSTGYLRVLSTAQRIAAECAWALGDQRLARAQIAEALAAAPGRTSAYVLARTYDVASRITKDRQYANLARELRAINA